tara:strand:- start:98 stop:328 length:231 start_codon:yes stop_codon:yes gene_type:complete
MSTKTVRYEFITTENFIDRLTYVAYGAGMTKMEAFVAGISLLEQLVAADKEGKEIAFIPKNEIIDSLKKLYYLNDQ